MKTLFFAIGIILSANSFATCIEDFRHLQNKKEVVLVKQREMTVGSQQSLKKLRQAELKAVKNYMEYMDFSFDENSLYVTTEQYRDVKTNMSSLGYKITVSSDNDESSVRYYIKIDVGLEDVSYLILYRIWDNPTPEAEFLCETF